MLCFDFRIREGMSPIGMLYSVMFRFPLEGRYSPEPSWFIDTRWRLTFRSIYNVVF